jgi:Kef-type K+ transport system membrane component KefB
MHTLASVDLSFTCGGVRVSSDELAAVLISLAILVACGHLLGHLCVRLRQPRLIGEIVVGVVLGPFVLGKLAPDLTIGLFGNPGSTEHATSTVLGFTYWLGLLLLMFISGSEARRVLAHENRRPTAWILAVGTSIPFIIVLFLGSFLSLGQLSGPASSRAAVVLVLAIAVAVTSIPVISRIFYDLGIIQTRFASVVLGVAILEDMLLWAALAVATALASQSALGGQVAGTVTSHVAATVAFMSAGLFLAPRLVRKLHRARWNLFEKATPVGYAVLILLIYSAVAALVDVNVVFAAFLAGFGFVGGFSGSERERYADALDAIGKVAFAVFIPLYFIMVGYQLQFGSGFSLPLLLAFLVGSSVLRAASVGIAARLAAFRRLDVVNLAFALNARGGPGIVLASVAFEAGIISGSFFTTLVLTAILTSQSAGVWLGYVLRRGWPLLSAEGVVTPVPPLGAVSLATHTGPGTASSPVKGELGKS